MWEIWGKKPLIATTAEECVKIQSNIIYDKYEL